MIKKLLNFTLFLCMLVLGTGNVWGEEKTFTLTSTEVVSGNTGTVTLGTNVYGSQATATESTWYTFAKGNFNFTGARICVASTSNGGGLQIQGNASDATKQGFLGNTTSFEKITSIKIVARTTSSSTYAPNFNVYVGSTQLPTSGALEIPTVTPTDDNSYKTYTYELTVSGANGFFAIRNDLAGALYVDEISVTYESGEAAKTATTTTFGADAQSSYTVYYGEAFTAPTATVSGGEGLAPTYSSSNTDVATIDATTGAVTLVAAGTTVIRASYAGDDTYEASSASYTLTVGKVYTNLAALVADGEPTSAGILIKVTLTDEVIQSIYTTSAGYRNGIFLKSGEKDVEIFCYDVPESWAANGTVSGTVTGSWKLYSSTWEIVISSWDQLTYTAAAKQNQTITLGTYKTTMTTADAADTYTASTNGDGTLSVVSSTPSVATVAISDGTVTVTPVAVGTTTITITAAATDTYNEGSKSYTLTVNTPATPATLPFTFDDGKAAATADKGMTQTGLGSDYGSSPKLKFDSAGDELVINFEGEAKTLAYTIKGNGSGSDAWDGTYEVLESANGTDYTTVKSYAEGDLTSTAINEVYTLNATSRYVKFVYVTKTTGNVALGAISIKAAGTLEDPKLAFEKETYTFESNATSMAVKATSAAGSTGAITYALTEGDENAFLIDENTGDIVCETAGTYTVTATIAATSDYSAGSATATVTIIEATSEATYYAIVSSYENGHYAMNNTYLNKSLGAVAVNAVNGKVINVNAKDKNAISWTLKADGSVQSAAGEYITYSKGDITLVEEASSSCVYEEATDDNGTYWVSNERTFIYRETATAKVFKNYATSNAGNSGYGTIGYVMTFADGYVRELTASEEETKAGTICLDRTIEAEDLGGAKFYSIAGKRVDADNNVTSVVLEEETDGLLAGYPYIFIATGNVVAAYTGEAEATTAESNQGLIGSLEGTAVAEGKYLISGNKLVKCGTGCKIGANRAYIDMDAVAVYTETSEAKGIVEIGANGLVDAIQGVNAAANNSVIYNIAGQRVNKAQKGLYIINGKKVVK